MCQSGSLTKENARISIEARNWKSRAFEAFRDFTALIALYFVVMNCAAYIKAPVLNNVSVADWYSARYPEASTWRAMIEKPTFVVYAWFVPTLGYGMRANLAADTAEPAQGSRAGDSPR